MLCAIACNDAETAHSAFHMMPKSIQDEPLTRYLMFKVALLNWDQNLGCQCIKFLSRLTGKSQCRDILYACVKEAQNIGHKLLTLEALKAVAETFDADSSWTINIPSVFRCIIRLIHSIESQDSDSTDHTTELAEETCRIFEKGKTYNY
jgi:hypothetical protein